MRRYMLALIAAGLFSSTLHAEVKFKTGGFLQWWNSATDGGAGDLKRNEALVTHLRALVVTQLNEKTSVTLLPELAGGVFFLDVFGTYKPEDEHLPQVTLGQFKFPFGQDRMPAPAGLDRVDYSIIDKAMFPGHPWDFGVMLSKSWGMLDLKAAAIEGKGPIITTTQGAVIAGRNRQDYSGSAELKMLEGKIKLGTSVYWGLGHATAFTMPQFWTGAHVHAMAGRFEFKGEWINQERGVYAVTVNPQLKVHSKVTLGAYWDRVEDPTGNFATLEKTQMGGVIHVTPLPTWRSSLEIYGNNTGPEQSPSSTTVVWQNQLKY